MDLYKIKEQGRDEKTTLLQKHGEKERQEDYSTSVALAINTI